MSSGDANFVKREQIDGTMTMTVILYARTSSTVFFGVNESCTVMEEPV